jgi:hypothetical protein
VIPALLWRCPLCSAQDALVHTLHWLRRDGLDCANCHARWSVRRVPGDDFYLRLVRAPAQGACQAGVERSLAAWYDLMKAGLRLEAVHDSQANLLTGETLYLVSQPVELWLAATDPLLSSGLAAAPKPAALSGEDMTTLAGIGRLFLTDRRLLWQAGPPPKSESFPLEHIQGAYTVLALGLAITLGQRLVFFRFLNESPLKWTTYFGLLSPWVQAETGRHLETSHW